jgi:Cyclic nucleotide-binding domain
MINPTSTVDLGKFVSHRQNLLTDDSDIIDVKNDGENFFYYIKYACIPTVLREALPVFRKRGEDTNKDVKRVKLEVASEIDGRELTAAEQTLLKVRERFNFFKSMDDGEVLSVAKDIAMVRLRRGEVLFEQGSDGDEVYFIIKGVVSVQLRKSDVEKFEVAKLSAGALFGEMSPITKEERSATIVSVDDNTTLLSFRLADDVTDSTVVAYEKMYRNFTFILADKLKAQNKMLAGHK